MARLTIFSSLAILCCGGAALGQEKTTLATGLTLDRVIRYEVRQQYETVQTMEEQSSKLLVEQHALMDLVIESTDRAGNAVVRIDAISYAARMENEDGPISIAFDLDTPQADGAERAAGVLGLEQALALAPLRATLRPDGTVIRVTGLDEAMAMAQGLPDIEPNLISFFDVDRLSDVLSAIFSADNGIGERARGDSWTMTKRVPIGVSGTLVAETTTTLSLADENAAGLVGVYSLRLEEPPVVSDSAPRLTVDKSEGQIISQWDLQEGSLINRVANLRVALTVTMGEDLSQKTESKSTTNIRRLPRQGG
ncbi:MAG: hypothetical protein EA380_06015 [Phycisphaeraceae bacterium]|nr:MAG: hypothetical protein EA380_06015 [Phycisphaeraceae bacterium]